MDNIYFRAVILIVAIFFGAGSWATARRRLHPAHRLSLDYMLSMFSITYALGGCVLFLFQADYLYRFYGAGAFLPNRTSFSLILVLTLAPYLVIPWTVTFMASVSRPKFLAHARAGIRAPAIRNDALIFASAAILMGSLVLLAPVVGTLASNAVNDLFATTSAASLYEQRQSVFENVSFVQGGIIYSVLPALSAILLFWRGPSPWLERATGSAVAIIAVIMNLGMFQIGPTLSFLLTCGFCYAVSRQGRLNVVAIATVGTLMLILLFLYSLIKVTGNQLSQAELFIMRLPIPLPYLIQMSGEYPNALSPHYSLPFELGQYMFPELRAAQGFVAMPQPSYIDAWFTYSPLFSIFVMLFISFLVTAFGNKFRRYGFDKGGDNQRLILWVVVAAPALYYAFQVDILALFVSSYSISFAAISSFSIFISSVILSGLTKGSSQVVNPHISLERE
jgi:hypothetical protein